MCFSCYYCQTGLERSLTPSLPPTAAMVPSERQKQVDKKLPACGVYSEPPLGIGSEEQQGGNTPWGTSATVSSCSADLSCVDGKALGCYGWWEGLAGSRMLSLCLSQLHSGNKAEKPAPLCLHHGALSTKAPSELSPDQPHREMLHAYGTSCQQLVGVVAMATGWDAVRTHRIK